MGFMDNLGSSLSGKIEKACIQVIDLRVLADSANTTVTENKGNCYAVNGNKKMGFGTDMVSIGTLTAAVKTVGSPHQNYADSITGSDEEAKKARELAQKKADTAIYTKVGGASVKTFWVQFNPSELQLYAMGGGRIQKTSFAENNGGSGLQFSKADARITMSVKLIFDNIDLDEAFAGDYLNLSASSIAKKATKAIKGKKDHMTVQQRIEGFTAALRSKYTRWVVFSWGSLVYSGIVNSIDSHYTMFDKKGAPIRGDMQLEIVLIDMEAEPYRLGTWLAMYKTAFSGDMSLGNSGQNMKAGFLNLGH